MPELPEVETVARGLARGLAGATFVAVDAARPDYVLSPPPDAAAHLAGRRVRSVTRHGKRVRILLAPRGELLLHLGMSGQVALVPPDTPVEPHTHLRIRLTPAGELRVRDPRRFGAVWISDPAAGAPVVPPHRMRHGRLPDALGPDALAIGLARFRTVLSRPRAIKALLLDQHAIAGLGNIYVDEILWASRVHPVTPADAIDRATVGAMHRHLRRILHAAIRAGGSTLRDYRDTTGAAGAYRDRHRVYGREHEPCPRCGARIVRVPIAGRSTFLCRRCQRPRGRRRRPA